MKKRVIVFVIVFSLAIVSVSVLAIAAMLLPVADIVVSNPNCTHVAGNKDDVSVTIDCNGFVANNDDRWKVEIRLLVVVRMDPETGQPVWDYTSGGMISEEYASAADLNAATIILTGSIGTGGNWPNHSNTGYEFQVVVMEKDGAVWREIKKSDPHEWDHP